MDSEENERILKQGEAQYTSGWSKQYAGSMRGDESTSSYWY